MPPQVGRMPGHQSNPSNPYAHLNPTHTLPHYQQQLSSIPQNPAGHSAFGSVHFNGGINPFTPSVGSVPSLQGGYSTGSGFGTGSGLNSEEAMKGFARGAALQQQQAQNAEAASLGLRTGTTTGRIREVWAANLEQEMVILRQLIQKYPFVSMVCFTSLRAAAYRLN